MIDTHVAGRPEDLRAAASYLTDVLGSGLSRLADTTVGQRLALESAWTGEAGSAFVERATALARAGDEVAEATGVLGEQLARLGSVLEGVQLGLAAVRAEAAAAGLELRGEWIVPPPTGPSAPGTEQAVEAARRATAYLSARRRRDELVARWEAALLELRDLAEANATTLAQATLGLLVSGYTAALSSRLVPVMNAQSAFKSAEATRLIGYGDDLAEALRSERLSPSPRYYDDYDDFMSRGLQSADDAKAAQDLASRPRLPTGLARGLSLVAPAAAAYGVYDDLQHGESVEQAVVSQGGGLLSGVLAGAAGGAAVGTFAGPVVGTIGGGIIGAAAGLAMSQRIDEHYESEAAEEAEEAEDEWRGDVERVRQLLNLSEGLPLFATPGSDGPAPDPLGPSPLAPPPGGRT